MADLEIAQQIQSHLRQLWKQLGQSSNESTIAQVHQSAQEFLSHLDPDPLTLARVAGVLLVYQLPDADPNEATWFKHELSNCEDSESVEELIDSLSRPDAL